MSHDLARRRCRRDDARRAGNFNQSLSCGPKAIRDKSSAACGARTCLRGDRRRCLVGRVVSADSAALAFVLGPPGQFLARPRGVNERWVVLRLASE